MSSNTPSPAPERRLLSAAEVAKLCGISRPYVYTLVSRGELPQPVYLTGTSHPKWWLHEIEAALEVSRKTHADSGEVRRERARARRRGDKLPPLAVGGAA